MNIVEMREKRAKLWNTMEGFLDTHRDSMGCLSAEDDAVYNNMEQELNALTNEIKRMERRDAIEAELRQPVSKPIVTMPQNPNMADNKVGRASDAYKEDFGKMLRQKHFISDVQAMYISKNVLFTSSQVSLFKDTAQFIIPDYYFNFELREEGETW